MISIAARVGSVSYDKALSKAQTSDNLFEVSPKNNAIPNLPPPAQKAAPHPKQEKENLLEAYEKLESFYNGLTCDGSFKAKLSQAHHNWIEAEQKLLKEVEKLSSVFEDFVFPVNKFSKRKAHVRGSSLYLPGLIKAVITDFNYRKFFSVKAAGGKRVYSVCLVLDVSLSMNGHVANCAIEALVLLIGSLRSAGIDTFSIVLFGETVRHVFLSFKNKFLG